MCQLMAMNCNVPTDICFSFEGFRARGGKTDQHTDGWGIAFFENKGCRLFLDDRASSESQIAELVRHYPIHSLNVIAHNKPITCAHSFRIFLNKIQRQSQRHVQQTDSQKKGKCPQS